MVAVRSAAYGGTMTDATQPVSCDEDAFYADPAAFFGHLRETGSITRVPMPDYGSAWVVTHDDDVRTALTDPRLAKDVGRFPGGGVSRPSEAVNLHTHMLNNDPPVHTHPAAPPRAAGLHPVYLLILAGFDTTVNLIANGTVALLTHPDQARRLRADPSLLPAAAEELLRFTNPLNHATDRFTTEDVPFGDVVIPAGEWVLIATSAASRDPDRFPDPDRLDLGRDAAGHVAFGHGIHHCVGATGPDGGRGRARRTARPLPRALARGPAGGAAPASHEADERARVPAGPPRLNGAERR